MKTVFSTADVHPRDRFDCWHDIASRIIIRHDGKPECRTSFQAELRTGALGDVELAGFEASPMTVAHTVRDAAAANDAGILMYRQIAGTLAFEQDGRHILMEPGDITLIEPRLSYVGKFSSGSKVLLVKVHRRELEARVGKTRTMIACTIKPTNGEGGLASTFLGLLPSYAETLRPSSAEVVKNQMLDLVAISLAAATDANRPRLSSARSVALMNVRAAIEARLSDPALDAATVAAAAGVTVRWASYTYHTQG